MRRLYETPAYDTGRAVGSFWEESTAGRLQFPPLEGDASAEVVIVGGGYTGLNAALQLAENHDISPVLLDAAQPGWGGRGAMAGLPVSGVRSYRRKIRSAGSG